MGLERTPHQTAILMKQRACCIKLQAIRRSKAAPVDRALNCRPVLPVHLLTVGNQHDPEVPVSSAAFAVQRAQCYNLGGPYGMAACQLYHLNSLRNNSLALISQKPL